MPIQPNLIDISKYRRAEFVGARILQARELNQMNDLAGDVPAGGKYDLGAVFVTGGLLNVQVQVSGNTVSLLPINPAEPMLVYLNGAFEVFTAGPISFTPKAAGTFDNIFCNYVYWRVTFDGANSTLRDTSLIDAITGQPTAEMAQVQVTFGADDHGAIDTVKMFDRNTVALPSVVLQWTGAGTLAFYGMYGYRDFAYAGPTHPGVVTTSTSLSKVVSDDDARLSNSRLPADTSVNTQKVIPDTPTGSQTTITFTNQNGQNDSTAIATVQTTDTSGGINAKRLFYETFAISVHDMLNLTWSKLLNAYAVLRDLTTRVHTLEVKPDIDLTFHVGHNLGEANSHPPVVDNATAANQWKGYEVRVATQLNTDYAFLVRTSNGTLLSGLDHSGNFQYLNPTFAPQLVHADQGIDFRTFFNLALMSGNFFANPVLGMQGDVTGATNGSVVTRLQGKPVSSAPPAIGDILQFDGSSWQTGQPVTPTAQTIQTTYGYWTIFRFAPNKQQGLEIAVGYGAAPHGAALELPAGFNTSSFFPMVSPRSYTDTGHPAHGVQLCALNNLVVQMSYNDGEGHTWYGVANWFAIAWRTA
jgi:hypothetical protein